VGRAGQGQAEETTGAKVVGHARHTRGRQVGEGASLRGTAPSTVSGKASKRGHSQGVARQSASIALPLRCADFVPLPWYGFRGAGQSKGSLSEISGPLSALRPSSD
jgi:hypothetical protein